MQRSESTQGELVQMYDTRIESEAKLEGETATGLSPHSSSDEPQVIQALFRVLLMTATG